MVIDCPGRTDAPDARFTVSTAASHEHSAPSPTSDAWPGESAPPSHGALPMLSVSVLKVTTSLPPKLPKTPETTRGASTNETDAAAMLPCAFSNDTTTLAAPSSPNTRDSSGSVGAVT